MPAKDELMENIGESFGYVNIMLDKKIEQTKLSVAEKSATTISGVITGLVLGVLGGTGATFGLIALAFLIAGDDFKPVALGFGIVSFALFVILGIIYLLKRQLIVNPAVRTVLGIFFDQSAKS